MHAVHQMFESPDAEATINFWLIPKTHSLNREKLMPSGIPNISVPPCQLHRLTLIMKMFIDGETLISAEGTTQ